MVATIALFLVVRFEYYERIIHRQEKQIEQYSKNVLKTQKEASQVISDMNAAVVGGLVSQQQYIKNDNSQTNTE